MLHFALSYEEARHFSPNGDAILKTSPRRGVLLRKKLFEFPENRVLGWMAADVADILQLFELAHDLFEAGVFAHPEPDAAVLRVGQWQTEDAVHIEGAAGKEAHDVGHRAWMVRESEFEDGVHGAGLSGQGSVGYFARVSICELAPPGGTIGNTLSNTSTGA